MSTETINEACLPFGLLSFAEKRKLKEAASKNNATVLMYVGGAKWAPVNYNPGDAFCETRTYKVEIFKETKTLNAKGTVFGLMSKSAQVSMRSVADLPGSKVYYFSSTHDWVLMQSSNWDRAFAYKVIYEVQ